MLFLTILCVFDIPRCHHPYYTLLTFIAEFPSLIALLNITCTMIHYPVTVQSGYLTRRNTSFSWFIDLCLHYIYIFYFLPEWLQSQRKTSSSWRLSPHPWLRFSGQYFLLDNQYLFPSFYGSFYSLLYIIPNWSLPSFRCCSSPSGPESSPESPSEDSVVPSVLKCGATNQSAPPSAP